MYKIGNKVNKLKYIESAHVFSWFSNKIDGFDYLKELFPLCRGQRCLTPLQSAPCKKLSHVPTNSSTLHKREAPTCTPTGVAEVVTINDSG